MNEASNMKKRKKLLNKLNCLIRRAKVPKYFHRFGPKTYTTVAAFEERVLKGEA
jgi:hypothetical protein